MNQSGIDAFVVNAINNYSTRLSRDFDNVAATGQSNVDSEATQQIVIVTFTLPTSGDIDNYLTVDSKFWGA